MKKYIGLFLGMLLLLTGCGKTKMSDVAGEFAKKVEASKSYKLSGTMEINSDEETFNYSLEVYHLKDDYYKVVLINQTNNHEQVILKNTDGLYVVTPNLNKSFKFDSVWPDNSSQAYLLGNLVNDINNDNEATLEEKDDLYVIKSTVNYPNNEELIYQKVYFNKDFIPEKVEVYNSEDIVKIKVVFKEVDLKAKLKEDDFKLEDLIDEEETNNKECANESCEKETDKKTSLTLDNIIYPLYLPENTHLSDSEVVNTETGERVILTFSGSKNFVLVEEVASVSDEFEIIPVFGEPLMMNDTIGALSSNSISFESNDVSYYLAGNDLSNKEMISIATSLGNSKTVLSTK